nr:hypothetical protein [uncultured Halomonas sp.]
MASKPWWKRGHKRIATGFDRALLFEFDALEEHRSFAANSLSGAIKSLEKKINQGVDAVDEEDRDAYREHMNEEYITISEVLPRVQWNSQFLVVYATFEHLLNEICRIVQRRSSFNLSFKDLNGSGIERSKNYLSKVAGVTTPFQTTHWQRAKLLGEVRNIIAHRNGEVDLPPGNNNCLGAKLSKEKHLVLKKYIPDQDDAQIILSEKFIKESISDLRKVLISIFDYELYEDDS